MLIVEDEPLVAMLLEDILAGLEIEVAGLAANLPDALRSADDARYDAAILDINLQGRMSYPAAHRLVQAGIPILFVTGYAAECIPAELRNVPVVAKPYRADQIGRALRQVLGLSVSA